MAMMVGIVQDGQQLRGKGWTRLVYTTITWATTRLGGVCGFEYDCKKHEGWEGKHGGTVPWDKEKED
jgi:hypothetical protein